MRPWGRHGSHGQGTVITFYIWCAVGAFIGGIAGLFIGGGGRVTRIEEVLVGVFGAFIGGDFVTAMMNSGVAPTAVTAGGLVNAVGGAVAMIVLLTLMRKAVGPMRAHRKPSSRGGR